MSAATIAADDSDVLPPGYAAFLPVLERLSEPLLRLIEGQLAQFERLIVDFHACEPAPQGEFEGLGGLTTHGDVAHLLQSELLLRAEAPLEFLRRLTERETLYLERHYADPGVKPLHRAVISVGPGTLGHGRIVALAAIFFLARTAAARGADFHWCFLPREDGPVWFDTVSINTVKRYLRAASYREMTVADVAEAERVWEMLVPDRPRGLSASRTDWAVAARPLTRRRPDRAGPAVAEAPNALSFALDPPMPGTPRSGEIVVRRGGHDRCRETIRFPDDSQCVAALRTPFRALKPEPVSAGPPIPPPPKPEGWEPHYLIAPNPRIRMIRLADGLLLLDWAGDGKFDLRCFVAIPADMDLAGVRVQGSMLSLVIHEVSDGKEVIRYGRFQIAGAGAPILAFSRSRAVPSKQLFRKRSRFAIPPLNVDNGAEFYAASGHAFRLAPGSVDGGSALVPMYNTPKTLFCNDVYRVVRVTENDTPLLRVLQSQRRRIDDYWLPNDDAIPARLLGMTYSAGERSLAYSVHRDLWTLPSVVVPGVSANQDAAQALRVAPPRGRAHRQDDDRRCNGALVVRQAPGRRRPGALDPVPRRRDDRARRTARSRYGRCGNRQGRARQRWHMGSDAGSGGRTRRAASLRPAEEQSVLFLRAVRACRAVRAGGRGRSGQAA